MIEFANALVNKKGDMMAEKRALLMALTDAEPDVEVAWNEWMNAEHLPERVNHIPGFLAARRFIAIEGQPKYVTAYEITSVNVLTTEAYLKLREKEAKLPPDSLHARGQRFPNFIRGIYEQLYPEEGKYQVPNTTVILAAGYDIPPDKEDEFEAWCQGEYVPIMGRVPGIVTVRCFAAAGGLSTKSGKTSGPKYVTFCDVESEKVLQGADFIKEPDTPWSSWVRTWYSRRYCVSGKRIYPKP